MDRYPEPQAQSDPIGHEGVQRLKKVLSSLSKAISEFEQKKLGRSVQELKLQLAKEFIKAEAWDDALRVLRPLWQAMSYRNEGWWDIVEDVGWALRAAAARTGDGDTVIAVDWELMNSTFSPKPDWRYDIIRALEGLQAVTFKPAVVIREQDLHSFLSATFAFEHAEGKVGELCMSQLTVTSQALSAAAPVTMTEVRITFEGSMRPVILQHKAMNNDAETRYGDIIYSRVALQDGPTVTDAQVPSRDWRSTALLGEADLTFHPRKSRVFEFVFPLRESGEARAVSAIFTLASPLFDLDYIVTFNRTVVPDVWWCQKLAKKRLLRVDPHAIQVLPKPPKMDMRFVALQEQYYTNEPIELQLDISNGEDDESIAKLVVGIVGDQAPPFVLRSAQPGEEKVDPNTAEAGSSYLDLGRIKSSSSTATVIDLLPVMLPAVYDVTVKLSYHLVSDIETPISKTTTIRLLVVSPFEANYDFSPRLDLAPWPSFFSYNENDISMKQDGQINPTGLGQKWCLTTRYASFAIEALIIEDVDIEILSLNGGITCSSSKAPATGSSPHPLSIQPNSIEESQFSVLTRKLSLDDRRSASLDLSLVIKWRRPSASASASSPSSSAQNQASTNTTRLPIPRLLVASSEPRVLATVTYSATPSASASLPILTLSYTIENPSLHFLTFSTIMTASELFAFSGPKQGTVQLLPLSRRTIRVRILPTVRGEWVKVGFVVMDRYFQKVLRVLPAAEEGMRGDKDGVAVWVPAEEDEEEV